MNDKTNLSGFDLYSAAKKWSVSLPNDDVCSAIFWAANGANIAGLPLPHETRYQMIGTQIVVAAILIGAGWPT